MTSMVSEEERDTSAQSRVDLWMDCVTVVKKYPLFGAGPDHFGLVVQEVGWPAGKKAHSLWFQLGAEIGVPGALRGVSRPSIVTNWTDTMNPASDVITIQAACPFQRSASVVPPVRAALDPMLAVTSTPGIRRPSEAPLTRPRATKAARVNVLLR